MSFFGELYLHTTRPFFGAELNDREAEYLAASFAELSVPGPVVDLGCGHGRHVARLQGRLPGGRAALGLDLDPMSLAEREGPFPAIRGDLLALPFADGALAGAIAWYSTLFVFDEVTERRVLGEIARCVRPGGLLLVQTSRREYFESLPPTTFDAELPGGERVKEINLFDGASGRSLGYRELVTRDGRTLSAPFAIRYYRVPELTALLEAHGFRVRWVHGGVGGEPVAEGTRDVIMGAERNG